MAQVSIFDVARYVLDRHGPMSTMKLQKLTYYCQAWHLAWNGRPLFAESFQAWANGPVCYDLFDAHRGRYSIDAESLRPGSADALGPLDVAHIDAVLAAYTPLSAAQLSRLTHSEGPWMEARAGLPPGSSSSAAITNESMQQYYATVDRDGVPVDQIHW